MKLSSAQENLVRLTERERKSRTNWDQLFEDLAEMFLPNRRGFQSFITQGEERFDEVGSSAPALARRSLQAAVSTMLRPSGRIWAQGRCKFDELNADPEVRVWHQTVTNLMFQYMYDPRAHMEAQLAMCDDDLVTFGSGITRIGWDRKGGHLRFRTRSLVGTYFFVDAVGQINGIVSFEEWTLRQIVERFGEDNLTKDMKRKYSQSKRNAKLDDKYELLHIVVPVADAQAMGMKFKQPFSSLWVSTKCKESLESKGFDYFPYVTPRWDVSTGEIYGRSPAMVALNDARLLQAMTETMVDAGEKALNPPLWGVSDLISGPLDLQAGGFNPVDTTGLNSAMAPVNPIQLGTLPDQIAEFMSIIEQRIGAAFYQDILQLPSARDGQLTATEINARLDQYMRQAAPVFSRIEHNYNAPLIKTVYTVLKVEGIIPPPPPAIQEVEYFTGEESIEFEYESPIKVARDKAEAMKTMETLQTVLPLAEAYPQVVDNFDPDFLARFVTGKMDLPQEAYTPIKQMMAVREQNAKKMEMAQQAEMIGKAGPALAQMGNLIPNAAKAGLIPGGNPEALPLPAPDTLPFEDIAGLEDVL